MTTHSDRDKDATTPRPLTSDGHAYELLDLQAKPIGIFPELALALGALAAWPRRTVFLLRRWTLGRGTIAVDQRWLVSLGLDGTYRQSPINRHWTIRDHHRHN